MNEISNEKCRSCDEYMDDYGKNIGYTTCETCRNTGLTITDYALEPIEDEP